MDGISMIIDLLSRSQGSFVQPRLYRDQFDNSKSIETNHVIEQHHGQGKCLRVVCLYGGGYDDDVSTIGHLISDPPFDLRQFVRVRLFDVQCCSRVQELGELLQQAFAKRGGVNQYSL